MGIIVEPYLIALLVIFLHYVDLNYKIYQSQFQFSAFVFGKKTT